MELFLRKGNKLYLLESPQEKAQKENKTTNAIYLQRRYQIQTNKVPADNYVFLERGWYELKEINKK